MRRRTFLGVGAASALLAACGGGTPALPPGSLSGTRFDLGHRLRDGGLPAPGERRTRALVIVGGGIAGLSAAWRLGKAGFSDYELLELESVPGGNARFGENAVSAYPWGAHYVPLPSREARAARLLLADLGVLHGDPDAPAPRYDERALCFAPHERLYRNGRWHEGLAPLAGASAAARDEWRRFHDRMDAFKAMKGADGRRAFAIPMALSSRDPALLALDRLTMAEWLRSAGFESEPVHWLVNYACRDDFGCDYRGVSAWAGIHYFASRSGEAANADADTVLTWPEGNGWIVRQLVARYAPPVTPDALVYRVEERVDAVELAVFLARENRSVTYEAEAVVWAAPLRFAARALAGADPRLVAALAEFESAPWLTANLTLDARPDDSTGAPLAWDNVLYDSPSLGYVVATHQRVEQPTGPTVLTYYLPLSSEAPAVARQRLAATPWSVWAESILADLAKPHPTLRSHVQRLDVFANGHAMVRPRPGFIWGEARRHALESPQRVHFAHSDASGFSLFEEAQYRGVAAAERVLERLGVRAPTFL